MKIFAYFQVHQPLRLKKFSLFEDSQELYSRYFDFGLAEAIMKKVAAKCYLPTNQALLELLDKHPEFKVNFSVTGVFMEQANMFAPEVADSFRELARHKNVEFLAETYYHSLASLYPEKLEFITQVARHADMLKGMGQQPKVFRNTELIYSNEIASIAESMGYRGILCEGVDWLGKSPNHAYVPQTCSNIKLLMRNYTLSDDVGYRFSARSWNHYPLTADKYSSWLSANQGECTNIFVDYETFGEHHWEDTGIREFLRHLPNEVSKHRHLEFANASEVAALHAQDRVDVPSVISWADAERDTSAWLGNEMQRTCFNEVREIGDLLKENGTEELFHVWRLLQTSDHLYYLSTKSMSDQDVHNYFSPYDSPFDAFINFMNIIRDFRQQVESR